MAKGFGYILKSYKDGKHYIGHTSDLNKRLKRHNAGENISTKYRRELSLVYFEESKSAAEAVARERYIKDLGAVRFLTKV